LTADTLRVNTHGVKTAESRHRKLLHPELVHRSARAEIDCDHDQEETGPWPRHRLSSERRWSGSPGSSGGNEPSRNFARRRVEPTLSVSTRSARRPDNPSSPRRDLRDRQPGAPDCIPPQSEGPGVARSPVPSPRSRASAFPAHGGFGAVRPRRTLVAHPAKRASTLGGSCLRSGRRPLLRVHRSGWLWGRSR
jgi:hypothetical protein